jgi:hypothetical protein
LSVAYPQTPGRVRLVIDGDAEYADHIAPLPNAGIVNHPMTLGQGLEINETLLGGSFRSFDFLVEEGEFYSIHEASRVPQPSVGAWVPTGLVVNEIAPAYSYFEATLDGSASLLHRPDLDTAVLAGPVTIWRRKEATVAAPATPVQRSLGAGQWINLKVPVTCAGGTDITFGFNSFDPAQSSNVWIDPPSGDDQEHSFAFNGTGEQVVTCAAGTWSIHVLRSALTSGNLAVDYQFTV